MADRLNHLVDLLNNEIHQQQDQLENVSMPLNIGKLKRLASKINTIIRERETIDDYIDNEDLSINHQNFDNL